MQIITNSHTITHIKGHKDRHKKMDQLSWQEKMNVYCDFMATKATQVEKIMAERVPLFQQVR